MKLFIANYSVNTSCGCHPEYDDRLRVVIAASESQALGFILECESDTKATGWAVREVDTSKPSLFDDDGDLVKCF